VFKIVIVNYDLLDAKGKKNFGKKREIISSIAYPFENKFEYNFSLTMKNSIFAIIL